MVEKKISVILPIYNAEKTIKQTIDSVIGQQYENYELIMVNDGSTDGSGKICEEYASKNDRIKYFNNSNHGVSYSRNFGVEKSTGDYIMFIDSDDLYVDGLFKTINKLLNDEQLDLIVFSYERIHENNNVKLMRTKQISVQQKKDRNIFIEKLQESFLFNQIWNKIYKKDILIKNNIKFDESISSGEDYIYNIKYIKHIESAKYIDEVYYKYYTKATGLSLKNDTNKIYIKLNNLEKHREFYEEEGYDLTYIDKNYVYTCLSGITSLVDEDKENTLENMKKYIDNEKIHMELCKIKKKNKSIKISIILKILLIKDVNSLERISRKLIWMRKIYRKIRLG